MDCKEAIDVMDEALEGRLAAPLNAGFLEHMAECGPCSSYFEHLRITRDVLQHLPAEPASGPRYAELLRAYREKFGPRRN